MFETLDHTIRFGSTPTFFYFEMDVVNAVTESWEITPIAIVSNEFGISETGSTLVEQYNEDDFRMRFRFRKNSIVDLVNIIQTDLEHQTRLLTNDY